MPQTTKLQSGVAIKQQTDGDLNNIIPDHSLNLDKLTVAALNNLIQMLRVPAGVISAFGGTVAPDGWIMCDGSSLLRADYPELFGAVGTAFGAPNGAEFRVPDLRGRFLRGVDGGTGRDPDVASRTVMNPGGNTTDNVGSIQPDQFRSHLHSIGFSNSITIPGAGPNPILHFTSGTPANSGTQGGLETRPLNAYVNYIIKY